MLSVCLSVHLYHAPSSTTVPFWRPFTVHPICYGTVVLSVCLSACNFGVFGQTVGWTRIPLGTEVGLGQGDIVLDEDPSPDGKRHSSPYHFLTHVYCGQTAARLSNC